MGNDSYWSCAGHEDGGDDSVFVSLHAESTVIITNELQELTRELLKAHWGKHAAVHREETTINTSK